MPPENYASMTLTLADGSRFMIRSGDGQAAYVIQELSDVMQTGLELGNRFTHELLVITAEGKRTKGIHEVNHPQICVIDPPVDETMLAIAMSHIGLAVANICLENGGILIHGALAVYSNPNDARHNSGVILAGPGTVGKSTASARIQPPWKSLCDDATLVVRDAQGNYWAHPYPTWSRFFSYADQKAIKGQWQVEQAVPLRMLFFLSQNEQDSTEALSAAQATAMLVEVINHVTHTSIRRFAIEDVHAARQKQIANAQRLAHAIPTHKLHISLSGAFWKEIEKVLPLPTEPLDKQPTFPPATPKPKTVDSWFDDGLIHFAYRGPSMNPTLQEPDLVDVRTYDGRAIQRGDVIYFHSPCDDKMIVHRVIEIQPSDAPPNTVRTRGDNNPCPDPYYLPTANIIGRAIAARRGAKRRPIHGGRMGLIVVRIAHSRKKARFLMTKIFHHLYHGATKTGIFVRLWKVLMPDCCHPKVIVYKSRPNDVYKLQIGLREIGSIDQHEKRWHIRIPYRLITDQTNLEFAQQRFQIAEQNRTKRMPLSSILKTN
jgi:SynChlorMet cassette protein ScmC